MKNELEKELKKIVKDIKEGNIKKQIANILTATRLLSPFILIPLMYFNKLNLFIVMVIIFSLTDAFDGYFARKYNAVSNFGKYLDAFVDKVFALSLLIPIIIKTTLNTNNLYLVSTNIILEVIISILNLYSFFKKLNPSSTTYGKIKTNFLFILVGLLYLSKLVIIKDIYLLIFIVLTLVLQLITIISYFDQIKKRKVLLKPSL